MIESNNSNFWQRTPIRNITLEVKDLQSLFAILKARQDVMFEKCKKDWLEANHDKSDEEKSKIILKGEDDFRITTVLRNKSGEEFHSTDSKIFGDERSSQEIEYISIDTTIRHRVANGSDIYPHCKIELYLSDAALFNPSAIISQGTLNESNVFVAGKDREWCEKTIKDIFGFLNQRGNMSAPLHAKFTYDFFLWFIYVPMIIFIAFKSNSSLKKFEQEYSLILIYFTSLMFFMIAIFIFRMVFDYIKWTYPTIEVKDYIGRKNIHKIMSGAIPISIT